MAATLFDALQKKLSGQDEDLPALAPQQSTIQSNLVAKSGKAIAPGAGVPAASDTTQQAATAAANTAIGQAQTSGRAAGAQIASESDLAASRAAFAKAQLESRGKVEKQNLATQAEQRGETTAANEANQNSQIDSNESLRIDTMNNTASNKLKDLASEFDVSVDNLFRNFEQSNQELAFRKDAAQLEEAGFLMSMSDNAYITEIKRVGQERQLGDKDNYQEELTHLVLGDNLDRTLQQLGFKDMIAADQRSFNQKLATLDQDSTIAAANAAIADASRVATWSGAGTAMDAGLRYADKKYGEDDQEDNTTPVKPLPKEETANMGDFVTDSSVPPIA